MLKNGDRDWMCTGIWSEQSQVSFSRSEVRYFVSVYLNCKQEQLYFLNSGTFKVRIVVKNNIHNLGISSFTEFAFGTDWRMEIIIKRILLMNIKIV